MASATLEKVRDEFLPSWADRATRWLTNPMGGGQERFVERRLGNFTILQYQHLTPDGDLQIGELSVSINCDEINTNHVGRTAQQVRQFASQAQKVADILTHIATPELGRNHEAGGSDAT